MTDLTLTLQFVALVVLLTLSGCFSMSETVMMAANRYRLRALASQGNRGAGLALDLLARTDRLLGVILLFNNLVNTGAATLVSVITLELFGNESWALGIATLLVTFAILVFSEITPKVIGANHADRLAPFVADPAHRSHVVATIDLDDAVEADTEKRTYAPLFSLSGSANYIFGYKGGKQNLTASLKNMASIAPGAGF